MTNKTISALSSASTIVGTEVLPIVQSSATVKVSVANLTSGLGTIIATKGGTGQTSYSVGDIIYADTTTTLAKLSDVATGNALISGGISTAPSWGKIGLTTHVSGILPVANGGTGLTALGPAFSAYMTNGSANQTLTANTNTKVIIDTADFDTNSNFNTSTYRFTPTVAGYYLISGYVGVNSSGALVETDIMIYKNGSRYRQTRYPLANGAGSITVTSVIYFNGSTDYVELWTNVNASGGYATFGNFNTYFSGAMIRGA